jgi:hypothetical protein
MEKVRGMFGVEEDGRKREWVVEGSIGHLVGLGVSFLVLVPLLIACRYAREKVCGMLGESGRVDGKGVWNVGWWVRVEEWLDVGVGGRQ